MLKIPNTELPQRAQSQLKKWQAKINSEPDYVVRVKLAKRQFGNYRKTATFESVHETLRTMCPGDERCQYCEDSHASDIDHFLPQSLYPEFVFEWENYLYTCPACNRSKGNRLSVISSVTNEDTLLTRSESQLVLPSAVGTLLLINPRIEDPLGFIQLDLQTFIFFPSDPDNSVNFRRAKHTIDVLKLNASHLTRARAQAYKNYLRLLRVYINESQPISLEKLKADIQTMNHWTVWKEMQRSHSVIPELTDLFTRAPEALDW